MRDRSLQKGVTVVLHRAPDHPRTAQGLRSAVGYAALGLQVRVVCVGPAAALLDGPATQLPLALGRARSTLAALGCPLVALPQPRDPAEICDPQRQSDVVICW